MSGPAQIVYLSQDGNAPSGISTYGFRVLGQYPSGRMVLLNGESASPMIPSELRDRVLCVPTSDSHGASAVAKQLRSIITGMPGNIVVMPNTGDTPWSATVQWLRGLSSSELDRVRILGILHSDVDTQFDMAERHIGIAPVWMAVSARCTSELEQRVAGTGAIVQKLYLPMPIPDNRREAGEGNSLRLVYAGRLEESQKCVSRLGAALVELDRRSIPFEATIVGDGPGRASLAETIDKSRVSNSVSLTGSLDRDRLQTILFQSDIVVLTSAYEGMPLALLEAMASGVCPVVMAVESGLPELIQDGVNGRVVPQGEVGTMVDVISELSTDRAQLSRLGRAARETVKTYFSPEVHFRRLTEIFDKLWTMPPPDPSQVAPNKTAEAIGELVSRLKRAGLPVAIFGVGMFGRKLVDGCLDEGIKVCGLFDSDAARHGWHYRGLRCAAPAEMAMPGIKAIAIGSLQFAEEMTLQVQTIFEGTGIRLPEIFSSAP